MRDERRTRARNAALGTNDPMTGGPFNLGCAWVDSTRLGSTRLANERYMAHTRGHAITSPCKR